MFLYFLVGLVWVEVSSLPTEQGTHLGQGKDVTFMETPINGGPNQDFPVPLLGNEDLSLRSKRQQKPIRLFLPRDQQTLPFQRHFLSDTFQLVNRNPKPLISPVEILQIPREAFVLPNENLPTRSSSGVANIPRPSLLNSADTSNTRRLFESPDFSKNYPFLKGGSIFPYASRFSQPTRVIYQKVPVIIEIIDRTKDSASPSSVLESTTNINEETHDRNSGFQPNSFREDIQKTANDINVGVVPLQPETSQLTDSVNISPNHRSPAFQPNSFRDIQTTANDISVGVIPSQTEVSKLKDSVNSGPISETTKTQTDERTSTVQDLIIGESLNDNKIVSSASSLVSVSHVSDELKKLDNSFNRPAVPEKSFTFRDGSFNHHFINEGTPDLTGESRAFKNTQRVLNPAFLSDGRNRGREPSINVESNQRDWHNVAVEDIITGIVNPEAILTLGGFGLRLRPKTREQTPTSSIQRHHQSFGDSTSTNFRDLSKIIKQPNKNQVNINQPDTLKQISDQDQRKLVHFTVPNTLPGQNENLKAKSFTANIGENTPSHETTAKSSDPAHKSLTTVTLGEPSPNVDEKVSITLDTNKAAADFRIPTLNTRPNESAIGLSLSNSFVNQSTDNIEGEVSSTQKPVPIFFIVKDKNITVASNSTSQIKLHNMNRMFSHIKKALNNLKEDSSSAKEAVKSLPRIEHPDLSSNMSDKISIINLKDLIGVLQKPKESGNQSDTESQNNLKDTNQQILVPVQPSNIIENVDTVVRIDEQSETTHEEQGILEDESLLNMDDFTIEEMITEEDLAVIDDILNDSLTLNTSVSEMSLPQAEINVDIVTLIDTDVQEDNQSGNTTELTVEFTTQREGNDHEEMSQKEVRDKFQTTQKGNQSDTTIDEKRPKQLTNSFAIEEDILLSEMDEKALSEIGFVVVTESPSIETTSTPIQTTQFYDTTQDPENNDPMDFESTIEETTLRTSLELLDLPESRKLSKPTVEETTLKSDTTTGNIISELLEDISQDVLVQDLPEEEHIFTTATTFDINTPIMEDTTVTPTPLLLETTESVTEVALTTEQSEDVKKPLKSTVSQNPQDLEKKEFRQLSKPISDESQSNVDFEQTTMMPVLNTDNDTNDEIEPMTTPLIETEETSTPSVVDSDDNLALVKFSLETTTTDDFNDFTTESPHMTIPTVSEGENNSSVKDINALKEMEMALFFIKTLLATTTPDPLVPDETEETSTAREEEMELTQTEPPELDQTEADTSVSIMLSVVTKKIPIDEIDVEVKETTTLPSDTLDTTESLSNDGLLPVKISNETLEPERTTSTTSSMIDEQDEEITTSSPESPQITEATEVLDIFPSLRTEGMNESSILSVSDSQKDTSVPSSPPMIDGQDKEITTSSPESSPITEASEVPDILPSLKSSERVDESSILSVSDSQKDETPSEITEVSDILPSKSSKKINESSILSVSDSQKDEKPSEITPISLDGEKNETLNVQSLEEEPLTLDPLAGKSEAEEVVAQPIAKELIPEEPHAKQPITMSPKTESKQTPDNETITISSIVEEPAQEVSTQSITTLPSTTVGTSMAVTEETELPSDITVKPPVSFDDILSNLHSKGVKPGRFVRPKTLPDPNLHKETVTDVKEDLKSRVEFTVVSTSKSVSSLPFNILNKPKRKEEPSKKGKIIIDRLMDELKSKKTTQPNNVKIIDGLLTELENKRNEIDTTTLLGRSVSSTSAIFAQTGSNRESIVDKMINEIKSQPEDNVKQTNIIDKLLNSFKKPSPPRDLQSGEISLSKSPQDTITDLRKEENERIKTLTEDQKRKLVVRKFIENLRRLMRDASDSKRTTKTKFERDLAAVLPKMNKILENEGMKKGENINIPNVNHTMTNNGKIPIPFLMKIKDALNIVVQEMSPNATSQAQNETEVTQPVDDILLIKTIKNQLEETPFKISETATPFKPSSSGTRLQIKLPQRIKERMKKLRDRKNFRVVTKVRKLRGKTKLENTLSPNSNEATIKTNSFQLLEKDKINQLVSGNVEETPIQPSSGTTGPVSPSGHELISLNNTFSIIEEKIMTEDSINEKRSITDRVRGKTISANEVKAKPSTTTNKENTEDLTIIEMMKDNVSTNNEEKTSIKEDTLLVAAPITGQVTILNTTKPTLKPEINTGTLKHIPLTTFKPLTSSSTSQSSIQSNNFEPVGSASSLSLSRSLTEDDRPSISSHSQYSYKISFGPDKLNYPSWYRP